MSKEAEAEALAMEYSPGAFNRGADALGTDTQPEALAMGTQGAAHVHAPPTATVAAAPSKSSLPVLDLLHWSESPTPNPSRSRISATNDSSAFINASDERPFIQPPIRSEVRTSQPAGGVSTISFGANLTLEESEQLQKRSSAITEDSALSPKRSASLSEMAKQRELSGTIFGAGRDTLTSRRPNSSAKSKELEGSNIFGRSSQDQLNTVTHKCLANNLNNYQENNVPPRTSVKVSNPAGGRSQIIFGCDGGQQQCKKQGQNQKAAELSGYDIFKDEANIAINNNNNNNNNQNERIISAAKKREMLGNDIFSDSNSINEGRPRRARQPPGGDSNLKLC